MEQDLEAFIADSCSALLAEWEHPQGRVRVEDLLAADDAAGSGGLPDTACAVAFAAGASEGHAAPAAARVAPASGAAPGLSSHRRGAAADIDVAPPATTDAPREWRCLNPSHGDDCFRCTPPPPPEEVNSWALVGDKASRSGERKLRRLVLHAPEWASEPAREASAAQLQRDGQSALAEVLLSRDSAALRKTSLVALCTHWRYKCDTWTPRAAATVSKVGPAGAADSSSSALAPRKRRSPPSPPQPPPESSILALRGVLRQCVALYASTHAGDWRVHAAAAAEPGAPIRTWNVRMYDAMLPIGSAFAAATAQDAALLAARAAWAPTADEQWWMSDDAALLLRADAHLQLLRTTVAATGAGLRSLTAAGHAISVPDAAIATSWTASAVQLDFLANTCGAALANARARQRGSKEHLMAAAEVLLAISAAMTQLVDTGRVRRAWCLARDGPTASQDGHFWPAFVCAVVHSKPAYELCAGVDVDQALAKLHHTVVGA